MTGGRRIIARKPLASIANETRIRICKLPPVLRAPGRAARPYSIQISSDLADYETQTRRRLATSSYRWLHRGIICRQRGCFHANPPEPQYLC